MQTEIAWIAFVRITIQIVQHGPCKVCNPLLCLVDMCAML